MTKNLAYYLKFNYTIRLKQYSDGTFFAEVEELPGCMTEADTQQEALLMIQDAKQAWLESALADNLTIPEPTTETFSGKLNVRIPKTLHKQLSHKAKAEGVSLNTLIISSLSHSASR